MKKDKSSNLSLLQSRTQLILSEYNTTNQEYLKLESPPPPRETKPEDGETELTIRCISKP